MNIGPVTILKIFVLGQISKKELFRSAILQLNFTYEETIFRNPYLCDMDFSIFFHSCANNWEYTSDFSDFCIYLNDSFAIWFYTILTCFLPIFMSRTESIFFSGSPVFQKVHLWNLHVMGSFRMQKFSQTKLVRDPVLP